MKKNSKKYKQALFDAKLDIIIQGAKDELESIQRSYAIPNYGYIDPDPRHREHIYDIYVQQSKK